MDKETMELFHRLGAAVTAVSDGIEDEGDRRYLGSTNDADMLAELKHLYFEWRFDHNDAGDQP